MLDIDLAVVNESLVQLSRNAEHGPDGPELAVAATAVLRRALTQLMNPDPVPTQADRTVWGYADSPDADEYHGTFKTREEAVARGRESYEGEPFCVIRGEIPDPAEYMGWFVNNLCQTISENMGENIIIPESHEDYPDPSGGAKKELESFVAGWLRRHCWPDFWQAAGEPEAIPGVDQQPNEASK